MARDPFTAKPLPSDPITAVAMDDDESLRCLKPHSAANSKTLIEF
jgi:hypothetical protein